MADGARVTATTIEKFTKGFENAVMRRRVWLDRAERNGNVKKKNSGLDYRWQVKMLQGNLQLNNGAQILNFNPYNPYTFATLPYVGYAMTNTITKREKLQNAGKEALIDYVSQIVGDLFDDIHDRFSETMYIDSGASGNAGHASGFNTMIGALTQTYDYTAKTATTAHSASAADPIGVPTATYAGISTVPGAVGGTWTGQWPLYGKGDAIFDFFSPLIINYTSTAFPTAGTSWADNCIEACRMGITFSNRNRASDGQADLILLSDNMYRLFKSKLDPKERVIVNQGAKDREYGISRESISFEGAEVTHEYGMNNDQGFGLNMDKFEVLSMQDSLFKSEGPHPNPVDRTDRYAVDFIGQYKYKSPRHHFSLVDVVGLGSTL